VQVFADVDRAMVVNSLDRALRDLCFFCIRVNSTLHTGRHASKHASENAGHLHPQVAARVWSLLTAPGSGGHLEVPTAPGYGGHFEVPTAPGSGGHLEIPAPPGFGGHSKVPTAPGPGREL
jgi:hypothetical protein